MTSSPLTSPLTMGTQHSSPRKTTATLIQNQQLMLQLLQSYMLQQQRVQLAQQSSNHQLSTSLTTAKQPVAITTQACSSHQNREIDERDLHVQTSVLDNFLTEGSEKSTGVSNMFYTSSDTVNKLLRGLSSVKPSDSIQKLSEETADVLPTFAKALGNSLLTSAGPSQESLNEHCVDDKGNGTDGQVQKDDQAGTLCLNVFLCYFVDCMSVNLKL